MTTTDIEKAEPAEPGTDIVPAEGGDGGFTPARQRRWSPTANPKAEALRTRLLLPFAAPDRVGRGHRCSTCSTCRAPSSPAARPVALVVVLDAHARRSWSAPRSSRRPRT